MGCGHWLARLHRNHERRAGRLIGLTPDEIEQIRTKHNFLTAHYRPRRFLPRSIRADSGGRIVELHPQQGPVWMTKWLTVLRKRSTAVMPSLMQRVEQGAETRPQNTLAASSQPGTNSPWCPALSQGHRPGQYHLRILTELIGCVPLPRRNRCSTPKRTRR